MRVDFRASIDVGGSEFYIEMEPLASGRWKPVLRSILRNTADPVRPLDKVDPQEVEHATAALREWAKAHNFPLVD